MESTQKLMDDIAEWSDMQFGKNRNPISILYHLKKEVPELIDSLEKYNTIKLNDDNKYKMLNECLYEFADCFMLLLDAARCFGLDVNVLEKYVNLKLEINKSREWGEPDENGVIEHIRKDEN